MEFSFGKVVLPHLHVFYGLTKAQHTAAPTGQVKWLSNLSHTYAIAPKPGFSCSSAFFAAEATCVHVRFT